VPLCIVDLLQVCVVADDTLLKSERDTFVSRPSDAKMWVGCSSWDDSTVILAEEALEVVALGKRLYVTRSDRAAEYLNIDPTGMADFGYGPETK
jgi:hypothetical protein